MAKTFDLSTLQLSAGTHQVQVKARASGYRDSNFSNSVSYVVSNSHTVTLTITTERHPAERDIFRIYDGQNTTGTLLYEKIGGGGSEYVLTPQTLICTSGYLYIELQGPGPLASGITTTGGVTGDTQIPHYGVNTPFEVTGNGTITIGDLDWDD